MSDQEREEEAVFAALTQAMAEYAEYTDVQEVLAVAERESDPAPEPQYTWDRPLGLALRR